MLHAPRQTGKTSCLLALRDHLNAEARYAALYINVEPAQSARNDVARAMQPILDDLAHESLQVLGSDAVERQRVELLARGGDGALGSIVR